MVEYKGSASPVLSVEVATPTYLLLVRGWDTVKKQYLRINIKLDGVLHEKTEFFRIPPGRHTIEMVEPGYVFEKWFSRSGDSWHEVIFDDPYRNPTGFIMPSGMAFIYCFVHEAVAPPAPEMGVSLILGLALILFGATVIAVTEATRHAGY